MARLWSHSVVHLANELKKIQGWKESELNESRTGKDSVLKVVIQLDTELKKIQNRKESKLNEYQNRKGFNTESGDSWI